jgi:Bacterial tandem repeat domain 1
MKVNSVIFFLGLVLATVLALPTVPTSLAARATPPLQFYHGVTADQHQTNFNTLSTTGYRMISLSAYGQPPNHRYAAVWVQRPGPSYYAIHEANATEYQSFFDTHSQDGYVSTIVTITGPPSAPILSGVMEQNGVTNWYQLCGLTTTQYTTVLQNSQASRYILKSFTEYGSPSDRRYCGIWYYNDQLENYTYFLDESYTAYQNTFNSEVLKPFWRPSYLSVSEDHQISSTFVDTDVGLWVARHGMTANDLQSENVKQQAAGRYIIHLQGGGTGSNTNYAALWSTQDIPTGYCTISINSAGHTSVTRYTPAQIFILAPRRNDCYHPFFFGSGA